MTKTIMILVAISFVLLGCVNIPPSSVTLSSEIGSAISGIHASNIKFIEQYFRQKELEIYSLREESLDIFFNKVIAGTTDPSAPPLSAQNLYQIKEQIEKINKKTDEYVSQLDQAKDLILERVEGDYRLIVEANSTITGLLQTAVDIKEAQKEGLLKIKEFSNGKINLTNIEEVINGYLDKYGNAAGAANGFVSQLELILEPEKGN